MGQPAARTCVAEQAEDDRGRNGTVHSRGEPVPNPKAVVGREQAGGEEAGVVRECAGPKESQLARAAVPLGRRDRVDAVRLDLAKGVALDVPSGDDFAQPLPPLALPSSGSCGRRRAPSQPLLAPADSILVRSTRTEGPRPRTRCARWPQATSIACGRRRSRAVGLAEVRRARWLGPPPPNSQR